jgi:hypothetical protein
MPELSPLVSGDPETVGGYRLAGRLGEGGQGAVYLAHGKYGEAVAVKLLHSRLGIDATARTRFAREAEAVRRVAPFCTARVLAADVDGAIPYLVSEYIDGPSLQEFVHRNGPLDAVTLRWLAIGTLTALAAVHQAGIVHRDFKPGNVLLSADGPRVVDFGIARALDVTSSLTSQVIGTPAYMAPEQFGGGPVGPAIDLFAWGSTMTYAATGTPPFGGGTVPVIITRILESAPRLDGLRAPVREMVTACLNKDPSNRPSAQDLLSRLLGTADEPASVTLADAARAVGPGVMGPGVVGAGVMGPGVVGTEPVNRPPSHPRPGRRGPVIAVAAAAAALLAVAGTWLYLGSLGRANTHAKSSTATPAATQAGTPASRTGVFTSVPNACTVPGAALPRRAKALSPKQVLNDADDQECTWKLYRADQALMLDLEVAAQSTVDAARGTLAGDRTYYGGQKANGGGTRDPEPLSGLGDEALAARASDQVDYGNGKQLSKSYYMGGAQVEVRDRNVIIKVRWSGSDYPPGVRQSYSLKGADFPYVQARQESIVLVRQVISHLS